MRKFNNTICAKIFLVIIALGVAYYRIYATWGHFNSKFASLDGGYYLDVAQNILAGTGLYTDISPFHQGLPYLPHPSTIYPLWPLCMAFFGQFFPLWSTAFILPAMLYILVLYAAFVAGRALYPKSLYAFGQIEVHGGHLFMLCFALQRGFFIATSRPYTEGLTYTLVLFALIVAKRYFETPGFLNGLLLGVMASLIFLTRTQLLVMLIALFAVALLACLIDIKQHGRAFIGLILGALLCFMPQWYWLNTFVHEDILWIFFRFDAYQATSYLPAMHEDYPLNGKFEFILDRLYGFLVGFLPLNKFGYHRVFYTLQLFVPLYALFVLPRMATTHLRSLLELGTREFLQRINLFALFVWTFALGGMLSLHVIHLDNPTHEWFFGTRHALIAIFLFFLCAASYISLGQKHKHIASILLLIFIGYGFSEMNTISRRAHKEIGHLPGKPYALIEWINAQTSADNYRIFAMPSNWGKRLAPFTAHAGYRDIRRHDTLNVLEAMTTHLRSDYVAVYRNWDQLDELGPFFKRKSLPGFSLIAELKDFDIYKPNN